MERFIQVYFYGTYHCPAESRYNCEDPVGCDKCLATNIRSCISYGNLDICLICMSEIEDFVIRHNIT
jgi:hypothetical protein